MRHVGLVSTQGSSFVVLPSHPQLKVPPSAEAQLSYAPIEDYLVFAICLWHGQKVTVLAVVLP